MSINILLLPLLGGYFFLSHFNKTKYDIERQSGYHLFFKSAIIGALFLLISYISIVLIDNMLANLSLYKLIKNYSLQLFTINYLAHTSLSFLIGSLSWIPLNRLFDEETETEKAIEKSSDIMEKLIYKAIYNGNLLQVTLKNNKVYVGFVLSNFHPALERKYIEILPIYSGYRDARDMSVILTTNYAKVYEQIEHSQDIKMDKDDFGKVLPISEIISMNIYDDKVFNLFNNS